MKQYEQLCIRDHFIFGKVCQDINNSQIILSALLNEEVHLSSSSVEHYMQEYKDNKYVRLDLLADDYDGGVYNAELQHESPNKERQLELPFRSRYYQAIIDSAFVKSGIDYAKIPETYIIFICTFDPFGLGLPKYTIEPTCLEDNQFHFYDKSHRIFFNTTADLSSLPLPTRNMLNYIQNNSVNDDSTKHIDDIVQNAIEQEIWKEAYMLTVVHDRDVFRDGYDSRQDEIDALEAIIADKDAYLAEKDACLAEKDASLAQKDACLAEKDAFLTEKDARIAELEAALKALK